MTQRCSLHDTLHKAYCCVHQQPVVEFIPSAASVSNYSMPAAKLTFTVSFVSWVPQLSATNTYTYTPPHTHTRARVGEILNIWPDILTPSTSLCTTLLQLSAVYYSTQAVGSILHSPHHIQPCYATRTFLCSSNVTSSNTTRFRIETVPY